MPNPSFHRTLRDKAAQRPVNSNVGLAERIEQMTRFLMYSMAHRKDRINERFSA